MKLMIQPLAENAFYHGLKPKGGGRIAIRGRMEGEDIIFEVEDNGVGFDTGKLLDDRKHVGIRNIRGRLKAMVNGTLEIESKIGVGTKVLIKIPKEVEP